MDWHEMGGPIRSFKEQMEYYYKPQKETEETLADILKAIQKHIALESNHHVTPSIGRGHVRIFSGVTDFWVTNDLPNGSYQKLVRSGKNPLGAMYSKNSTIGRTVQRNCEGHFTAKLPGGIVSFDILNSSNYIPTSATDAERLEVGIMGKGYVRLASLHDALLRVGAMAQQHKDKQAELNAQIEEEERKRKEAAELAAKREAEIKKAKDEAERKRLEEEQRRLAEEQRKREQEAEEEIRRKAEEVNELSEKLRADAEKYAQAALFIRKQASLRLNPRIDDIQDEIKFSNLYNGVVTVIDGGPGTGKTTTLIQRLRLLISEEDLKDYCLNHDFKIAQSKYNVIKQNGGDWIFFSPTDLLKQYLKDNMNYEGLTSTTTKVVEWKDYLRRILRDQYHLAGEKAPFRFKMREHEGTTLIKSGEMELAQQYISYFVNFVKEDILKVTSLDLSKFPSWSTFGAMVTKRCKEAESASKVSDLIKLLLSLHSIIDAEMPANALNGADLAKEYAERINQIALEQMVILKKDENLYSQLLDWLDYVLYGEDDAEDDTDQEIDDEDIEDEIDEDYTQDLENELKKRIKSLLRNMALATVEKTSLKGKQLELKNLLGDSINTVLLKELGELAFYNKRVHPILRNMEIFLMSRIPKSYKKFRKEIAKEPDANVWNVDILKNIVSKQSNRTLHPQEQALLLGFINNLVLDVRKVSIKRFDSLKHKYSLAYKECCKPVIGIDEATDYCLLDYYGISSLRHYEVCAVTLTGDSMQCLRSNGIMDWNLLRHPLIFPELEVKELTTSYRQSPELVKLAHALYQNSMGRPAPYNCYLEEMHEAVPKPLWFESDDETRKARWIVDRILEVKRSYGFVPSIAIFVNNHEEAKELESAILDLGRLEEAGVKIADCSGGDKMSTNDTVRIFPLNSVKGMEFEVVFFYNVDEIEKMVDRYLYVGLSRATFYMAVTANKLSADRLEAIKKFFGRGDGKTNKLEEIRNLFVTRGDWRRISNNNQ